MNIIGLVLASFAFVLGVVNLILQNKVKPLKGDKGDKGDKGEKGVAGTKGDKGDSGANGEKGKDGHITEGALTGERVIELLAQVKEINLENSAITGKAFFETLKK